VPLAFWRCVIVGEPDNERHTGGNPRIRHCQFPIPKNHLMTRLLYLDENIAEVEEKLNGSSVTDQTALTVT
jgi:hypothetical protein